MVKVDVERQRQESRLLPLHQRRIVATSTSAARRPARPAPLETLETRQTFGGPLWNVLGNWTTTLSQQRVQRAAGDATASTSRGFSRNIAGGLGGSDLLAAAGYNTTVGNPTGKFARISYPGANFGATSFTGLEGEGNLFIIDNFSFIAGHHQFKFGGMVARQQMYMDVEAAHNGIWSFTQDKQFDANDPSTLSDQLQRQHRHRRRQPVGVESVRLRPGHVAGRQQPDAQPRARATTST